MKYFSTHKIINSYQTNNIFTKMSHQKYFYKYKKKKSMTPRHLVFFIFLRSNRSKKTLLGGMTNELCSCVLAINTTNLRILCVKIFFVYYSFYNKIIKMR